MKSLKPKKIRYLVTEDDHGYGDYINGDKVDAWLLVKEFNIGLVFHPRHIHPDTKALQCGCISVCRSNNSTDSEWVAYEKNTRAFVNLTKAQANFLVKAFGIPNRQI